MRAIVMTSAGDPNVLVAQDVPVPVPAGGEVLVRVEAIGTHFAETLLRSGVYPLPVPTPTVFGTQAVGVVTACGAGVERDWLGARVALSTMGGGYAEYVSAQVAALTPIPDELSSIDAVAVVMQGSVALAVLERAGIVAGDVVLVEAAATGVGGYLAQLASQERAVVLGTAGSAKQEQARKLGVRHVVDSADPDWQRQLADQLGGRSFDVVFESIGGESAVGLLDLMTPLRGRMVHYGMLSGRPAAVTSMDLMSRGVTMVGCGGLAFHARLAETRRQAIEFAVSGRLVPLVDSTLPLEQAARAHRLIEAREHRGMVVLTV